MLMNNLPFKAADILIPKGNNDSHTKFAVVACDQFTSQPEYWSEADKIAGDDYSSLRLTLPEIYLEGDISGRIESINANMQKYLDDDIFNEYKDAMVYVERELPDGSVRRGLIGAVDLPEYDFRPEKKAKIRATEGTVLERIPPRVKIRRDAALELPHVMMLVDDPQRTVIEPLENMKGECLYDFPLMLGGGQLKGFLVNSDAQKQILGALEAFNVGENPLIFAVGDGNHSLATAKACYELTPNELSRYALVEVVNIHDEALVFEPIYRVLFGVNPQQLFDEIKAKIDCGEGEEVEFISADCCGKFYTDGFPVGSLQDFLDDYIKRNPAVKIDYIHGEDVVRRLAAGENCAGFLYGAINKGELFNIIRRDGVLPRKAFSMGEAASKRYYMESRKIK